MKKIILIAFLLATACAHDKFRDNRELIEAGNIDEGLTRIAEQVKQNPNDVELRNYYLRHRAVAVQNWLAAGENTVPRRTIVSSRHTQTALTCIVAMPSTTMTTTGTRTAVGAPSRSIQSSGTITACTNSDPASATASTTRSVRTVRCPMAFSYRRTTIIYR